MGPDLVGFANVVAIGSRRNRPAGYSQLALGCSKKAARSATDSARPRRHSPRPLARRRVDLCSEERERQCDVHTAGGWTRFGSPEAIEYAINEVVRALE